MYDMLIWERGGWRQFAILDDENARKVVSRAHGHVIAVDPSGFVAYGADTGHKLPARKAAR